MGSFDTAIHSPHLRILSDDQLRNIYRATLSCLQRTGVEIHNQEARQLLYDAGAEIDDHRVRIPSNVIETTLADAPDAFTIYGQNQQWDMSIESGQVRFGPGPTCTYFMDPQPGQKRKTQKGDPALTARVCSALDNMDYVMSLGLIDDVISSLASVYEFAQMITHTGKPVLGWAFKKDHLEDIYKIACAVSGSEKAFKQRPNFGFFSTWQAPLTHTDKDLANCLWAVEKNIPVIYMGGGVAGLSAPVTGAGLLVSNLACMLSGLAIFSTAETGCPCLPRGDSNTHGSSNGTCGLWWTRNESILCSYFRDQPIFGCSVYGDRRCFGIKGNGSSGSYRKHPAGNPVPVEQGQYGA